MWEDPVPQDSNAVVIGRIEVPHLETRDDAMIQKKKKKIPSPAPPSSVSLSTQELYERKPCADAVILPYCTSTHHQADRLISPREMSVMVIWIPHGIETS